MSSLAIVGLGYGDEGKGSMVDYYVRERNANLVIRFNGGPQASHHVVLPDGRYHGFAQYGSGTFKGVPTYLSDLMMVEPYAIENETDALIRSGIPHPKDLLTVDFMCPIITPWHWRLNRMRESARTKKHGTCGMGIGELRLDMTSGLPVMRVRDIYSGNAIEKLSRIQKHKASEALHIAGETGQTILMDTNFNPESVADFYRGVFRDIRCVHEMDCTNAIYEGAQGVLLDEIYGWLPHTTWSNCTPSQAFQIAQDELDVIGVLPLIYSRHGAGPFVTEVDRYNARLNDHNKAGLWQGMFRVGPFDAMAARYALEVSGIKKVALTMADQYRGDVCVGYKMPNRPEEPMAHHITDGMRANMAEMRPVYRTGVPIEEIESIIGAEVVCISRGPTCHDKSHP